MTIEKYLENIWREDFLKEWLSYIKELNPQTALQLIKAAEEIKSIDNPEIKQQVNERVKDIKMKMWYLHYLMIEITPIAKTKINSCKSNEDFYNYLRWKESHIFASLIDDCLYPNEVNKEKEVLEIYLNNRNVLIKNGKIWDKNIQLAAYTKIQQTLINKSIDQLITTTEKVSQESWETSKEALWEAKKSNRTAMMALWIAWITWLTSIVVGILSYMSSEKTDYLQMNTLSWINNQLIDIENTINSLLWSYKQSTIEDKLNQQIEILNKINSKK